MAKILALEALIAVARENGVAGIDTLERVIEEAATVLANGVATRLGIVTTGACNDLGGVMATFYAAHAAQACPMPIAQGDAEGEWEPLLRHHRQQDAALPAST